MLKYFQKRLYCLVAYDKIWIIIFSVLRYDNLINQIIHVQKIILHWSCSFGIHCCQLILQGRVECVLMEQRRGHCSDGSTGGGGIMGIHPPNPNLQLKEKNSVEPSPPQKKKSQIYNNFEQLFVVYPRPKSRSGTAPVIVVELNLKHSIIKLDAWRPSFQGSEERV